MCVQDVGSIAGNKKKKYHLITLNELTQGCPPRPRSRRSRSSRACPATRWRRASRPGRAPPIPRSSSDRSENTTPNTSPAACQPTEPAPTRGPGPSTQPPATRSSRLAPATRPAATPTYSPSPADPPSIPPISQGRHRHLSTRLVQRRHQSSRSIAAARSARAAQHPRPRRALSTGAMSCCRIPTPPAAAATACKPE